MVRVGVQVASILPSPRSGETNSEAGKSTCWELFLRPFGTLNIFLSLRLEYLLRSTHIAVLRCNHWGIFMMKSRFAGVCILALAPLVTIGCGEEALLDEPNEAMSGEVETETETEVGDEPAELVTFSELTPEGDVVAWVRARAICWRMVRDCHDALSTAELLRGDSSDLRGR